MQQFFKITDRSGMARSGKITTKHGTIETPYLFTVATVASVRSLTTQEIEQLGAQAILANTYHLMLRPGVDVMQKAGGLHNFMNWHKPIATDSGGFQVFSLGSGLEHGVGKVLGFIPGKNTKPISEAKPKLVKISDNGVEFRDHISGEKHFLTPEKSMEIQHILGSDIRFAFDELTSPFDTKEYVAQSLERTHRWAKRSLDTHKKINDGPASTRGASSTRGGSALFGVIQGGPYKDLRKQAINQIASMDFDGFGIGGILGKTKQEVHDMTAWICGELEKQAPKKPRHWLGIGDIDDLVAGVKMGIDLFDVVLPTRLARRGVFFTNQKPKYKSDITLAKYRLDFKPLVKDCTCPTCQNHTRAYIHHLMRGSELTAYHLMTTHNIHFVLRLMERLRQAIKSGKIDQFEV